MYERFIRGDLQTRIKGFCVHRDCKILLEDSQLKMARWIKEVISSMTIMEKNVFQKVGGTRKALANLQGKMNHSKELRN